MVEATSISSLLPTPARKTSPPESKSLNVRRERLIDILRRDGRDLTLVVGAAGAGKTVLASQWSTELAAPVAWVTLDTTDNDPVVLISSVMDALARAGLEGNWNELPLTSDEPTYSRGVVPYFQHCLASQTAPFTLVLDDAHEVTEPRTVWLLRSAIDSLPTGSHGIVVGRALTALPVATWLASERAIVLTDSELAMTSGEVSEVVTGLVGAAPDHAAVADLLQATHGWPIAVYLGSHLAEPARLGHLTYFSDFLDQEVLRGADVETLDLLKATSPLLDLSGELCDYVLQRGASADVLKRAERTSLLVTRSQEHDWFRLHPLLRDHLQEQLRRDEPSLFRTVTQRASEWSQAKGHTDRAIWYSRQSGDPELLGTTIWEAAAVALTTGQSQRVVGWLGAVDDATIAGSLPLALTAAWCAVSGGQPADAYRWSRAALGNAYDGWEANLHGSTMEAGLALLASTSGSMGYARSAAFATEAMRSLPNSHVVVPYAQVVAGWMHLLGGSWDIGMEELRRAVHLAHSSGLWSTEVEAKALLAVALLSRGDHLAAEPLVREALGTLEQESMGHFLATGALVAGPAALVAARAGQRDLAEGQLARVRESVTMFGPILPWSVSIHESCAAAAYALLGDQPRAGRHLRSATDATEGLPASRLLTNLLEGARSAVEGEFRLSHLSPAERRVFERLLTRATLREIAASLFVSPETVKSQAGSIYRKLGVSSRRDLQDLGDRLRSTPATDGSWPARSPR